MSPEQQVERALGTRSSAYELSTALAPGTDLPLQLRRSYPSDTSTLLIWASDFRIDAVSRPFYFLETTWPRTDAKSFTLESGQWPRHPGEVAVSPSLVSALARTSHLSALSGRAQLRVSGVVSYTFDTKGDFVYAAPGTWAGLDPRSSQASQKLSSGVTLLTDLPGSASRTPLPAYGEAAFVWRADRASLLATPEGHWLAQSPFAYYLPTALLPVLTTLWSLAITRQRWQRFATTSIALGARPAMARRWITLTLITGQLAGVAVGTVIGVALGALSRNVIDSWIEHPLGPWPSLGGTVVVVVFLCMVTAAFGTRSLSPRTPEPGAAGPRAEPRSPSRSRNAHRAAVLLIFLAALIPAWAPIPGGVGRAMLAASCLLLAFVVVSREIVDLTTQVLSRDEPAWRFVRRTSRRAGAASVASFAVLLVLLALPLTTVTMLYASSSTARAQLLAVVAPGQISVQGAGGSADTPPAAAVELLEDHGILDPAAKRRLGSVDGALLVPPGNNGTIYVFDDPGAAQDVLARTFTSEQRRILSTGGILVWGVSGTDKGVTIQTSTRTLASVPAISYKPAEEWAALSGGAMLASTVHALGLKEPTTGVPVYVSTTTSAGERAKQVLDRAGLDPSLVVTHHQRRSLVPPAPIVASATVLTLAMVALVLGSLRGAMRSLQQQVGTFQAIGVDRRFVMKLVVTQHFTVAIAALGGALAVTIFAAAWLLLSSPTTTLDLRAAEIPIVLGTFVVAVLISAYLNWRSLASRLPRAT